MDRNEAIKELQTKYLGDSEQIREAKDMAIEALRKPTMTVADLIDNGFNGFGEQDPVLEGVLIAYDGRTGKVLFNTARNKREYIEKFKSGRVLSLWSGLDSVTEVGFRTITRTVIKCHIAHDSWKKGDGE